MKQHHQNKASNQSATATSNNRVDKTSLNEQFYSNPLAAPSVQSGQGGELTNLEEEEEDFEAHMFMMGN